MAMMGGNGWEVWDKGGGTARNGTVSAAWVFVWRFVCIASLGVGGFLRHELCEPDIETDSAAKAMLSVGLGWAVCLQRWGWETASTEVCRLV